VVKIARLTLSVVLMWAALAAPAWGSTTWVIRGAGFGPGVGMSAYGAYGYGVHGAGYRAILSHYYTGTRVTTLQAPRPVRVLLEISTGDVAFTGATAGCGLMLVASRTYRVRSNRRTVSLLSGSGKRLGSCGARLRAAGTAPLGIAGLGHYRGELVFVATAQGLDVVNRVDVNDYAQGSLPAEVFPSWPRPTLAAFAVAMRSVGLTAHAGGSIYDVYSDTRTQLYKGVSVETPRTNRIVQSTGDEVVTYGGQIAQTTYFPSSGGRTESGYVGGPRLPYLKSVSDPYDYYAPLHRWTMRLTQAQMDGRLASYVRGRLRRIVVTERGDSPRIVSATLVGTGGRTPIRGDTLQSALGLYSNWAYFKRVG
jgi:stage II sporulation protein D